MASNSTGKSPEEETITCSFCQNILENPPRLDCLHSFCDKCLKNVDHTVQTGRKGILCPLCRKFTSEPHIKKDPILEDIITAFSEYYDNNILNKDTVNKVCSQCDRKINVTCYCLDCKAGLCKTCNIRHLRFEAMSEHRIVPMAEAQTSPVINDTKFCPKHETKPIKLSCVSCKLAICVDCKIEDHDTHKTEDVTSALAGVLTELRASIPLLGAEKKKQVEVKHNIVSLVKNVTRLGKEILGNAEKARDDLISRAMRDYNKIEETVTNFVQSVTKEASLREDDANNSISSIDSMSSRINVLADITEGPAVLFELRNKGLLDRIRALLTECERSRDVRELYSMADRKPRFTKTLMKSHNLVGSIQFVQPTAISSIDELLGNSWFGNLLAPELLLINTNFETTPPPPLAQDPKLTTQIVPTKQSTSPVKSFRQIENILCGLKVKKQRGSFKLKTLCTRFCYHLESLWCPSNNRIDIYSLEGQLLTSLECPHVEYITALHPLTPTCMLLSADSTLHTYDPIDQTVRNTLREGEFWDVHASGTHIVALEKGTYPGDMVHVYITADPPTHLYSFCVDQRDPLRVMVQDEKVYISARYGRTSVSVYSLEGEIISQYGCFGKGKGEDCLYLCAVDSEESLLIADYNNKCMKLMDREGEFSVLKGVGVYCPCDAVIAGKNLFVLYKSLKGTKIQRYEL